MRRNADGVSHIWKEIVLPNLSVQRQNGADVWNRVHWIIRLATSTATVFFLQFNPFKLGFRWVVGEIEKRLAIPRAWRHPICDSVFKAGWLCLDALFFVVVGCPHLHRFAAASMLLDTIQKSSWASTISRVRHSTPFFPSEKEKEKKIYVSFE